MGKMKEVYMRFLEERKYEKSLTEDEWLRRVAASKQRNTKQEVTTGQEPTNNQDEDDSNIGVSGH